MDGNNMPGQQPQNEFSQSNYLQPQNNMGQNPYQQPQNNNMGQNPYQQPQNNNMGQNPYQQSQADYGQYQQQSSFDQGGYQQQPFSQQVQPGYQGSYDQGGYQNSGYEQQNYYQQPKELSPGFSIASMVCGILSLVLFCCLWKYDLVLSIPAVALGVIGLKKEQNGKGMAIAGIICGAIALLLGITFIIISIVILPAIGHRCPLTKTSALLDRTLL